MMDRDNPLCGDAGKVDGDAVNDPTSLTTGGLPKVIHEKVKRGPGRGKNVELVQSRRNFNLELIDTHMISPTQRVSSGTATKR